MVIENGKFYFLKDEFFDVFKDLKLMLNKDYGTKRPCYLCFKDSENENIIWFVPISSKVEKYRKIYKKKVKTRKQVYNFVFGKVLDRGTVFLIQNIFPTTTIFIENKYINNKKDVEISNNLKEKVIQTSRKVIEMANNGIKIPFYDITKMKKILIEKYIK